METQNRPLVNPVAVDRCSVRWEEMSARVLDLSYLRIVIEDTVPSGFPVSEEPVELKFELEGHRFTTRVLKQGGGAGWVRLAFEKKVPSIHAHLRSFLSPKKIGESLWEDWKSDQLRHFHGLNECELWFQTEGAVFFTFLDPADLESQILIRLPETRSPLVVGRILRKDYMELNRMDGDLPVKPLPDGEAYSRLSECRDIITNFRPVEAQDYNLKQRLLKALNESLYSTSRRVEMTPRKPAATPS